MSESKPFELSAPAGAATNPPAKPKKRKISTAITVLAILVIVLIVWSAKQGVLGNSALARRGLRYGRPPARGSGRGAGADTDPGPGAADPEIDSLIQSINAA